MSNISQLFGDIDIDILSLVRTTWLNWIRDVNRIDYKRKVITYLIKIPRAVD